MRYVAGLDGLRALAVAVVLFFHAEIPFFDGGFLGVSLFFTLSGFLITSLLLAEHDSSGTISLRGFYGRRARRLLPAAYACLAAVAACAPLWSAAQLRSLGGDLVAAVANVANWRFAFSTTSYAELFTTAPSPVAHFWSLAIEEQVYLFLPLVVVLALRNGRRSLLAITGVLLIASVGATLVTRDHDLIYNGTHTRVAEVLVGMLLAQLVAGRRSSFGPTSVGRWRWVPGAAGVAVFGGLVATASIAQEWIYRGGLPLVAVVSSVIIWAVVDGRFPAGLLAFGPLVAIGRVSYGIYLFHWPVFLLLDADRVGVDGIPLFGVRCLVTGLLTMMSYQLIEQPVRTRRVLAGPAMVPTAGVVAIGIVVAAVIAVPAPKLTADERLLVAGSQDVFEFAGGAGDAGEASGTMPPPGPNRVVVVGSDPWLAEDLLAGLGDAVSVTDATRPQCPLSAPASKACAPLAEVVEPLLADGPALFVFAASNAESLDVQTRRQRYGDDNFLEFNALENAAELEALDAIDRADTPESSVIWYTSNDAESPYHQSFERIGVMRPELTVVQGPRTELLHEVKSAVMEDAAEAADAAGTVRVLVIGDSTSLPMAAALNDGGDGRVSVLWAGANGCPVAHVVSISPGKAGWLPIDCPLYDEKLPPIIGDFDPDALMVVTGPTELHDLEFVDGTRGAVGDSNYADHSATGFARILSAVDPGIPVLVADIPAVIAGPGIGENLTSPERLEAANRQVEEWGEASSQVAVFRYRDTLESHEARHGSLRPDGLHADVGRLAELVREVYLDQLLTQIDELRAILPS